MATNEMSLFDAGHRLALPGGYWLSKSDDNRWQVGKDGMFLGFGIDGNVPVGRGGSMDKTIKDFADAMASNAVVETDPACGAKAARRNG
jgi:hypothetical protein